MAPAGALEAIARGERFAVAGAVAVVAERHDVRLDLEHVDELAVVLRRRGRVPDRVGRALHLALEAADLVLDDRTVGRLELFEARDREYVLDTVAELGEVRLGDAVGLRVDDDLLAAERGDETGETGFEASEHRDDGRAARELLVHMRKISSQKKSPQAHPKAPA